jgi:hypothetical protein
MQECTVAGHSQLFALLQVESNSTARTNGTISYLACGTCLLFSQQWYQLWKSFLYVARLIWNWTRIKLCCCIHLPGHKGSIQRDSNLISEVFLTSLHTCISWRGILTNIYNVYGTSFISMQNEPEKLHDIHFWTTEHMQQKWSSGISSFQMFSTSVDCGKPGLNAWKHQLIKWQEICVTFEQMSVLLSQIQEC